LMPAEGREKPWALERHTAGGADISHVESETATLGPAGPIRTADARAKPVQPIPHTAVVARFSRVVGNAAKAGPANGAWAERRKGTDPQRAVDQAEAALKAAWRGGKGRREDAWVAGPKKNAAG